MFVFDPLSMYAILLCKLTIKLGFVTELQQYWAITAVSHPDCSHLTILTITAAAVIMIILLHMADWQDWRSLSDEFDKLSSAGRVWVTAPANRNTIKLQILRHLATRDVRNHCL